MEKIMKTGKQTKKAESESESDTQNLSQAHNDVDDAEIDDIRETRFIRYIIGY